MTSTPTPEQIVLLDQALDRYMSSRPEFQGNQWRQACHQGAKIAAAALNMIWPGCGARVQRVQLLAYMEGGSGFVHIGWPDDPSRIEGKYPMHWAVCLGADLYDPTFWQLTRARTPLQLPPEPFCFVPGLAVRMADPANRDQDGIVWMSSPCAPGFRFGYGLVERDLPPGECELLIAGSTARMHGCTVAQIFRDSLTLYLADPHTDW